MSTQATSAIRTRIPGQLGENLAVVIETEGAAGGPGSDPAPPSPLEAVDQEPAATYGGLPVELLLGTLPAPATYGQGCFVCHRPFADERRPSTDGFSASAGDLARDGRGSAAAAGKSGGRTGLPDVGVDLVDVKRTEEDVIPKWLLRSLGLGNAGAVMPNGQLFRYGHRKVPCCLMCNQRMSATLEMPVSAAFRAGRDGVLDLDERVMFLWLAKIYYGTRFRETGLRADVSLSDSGAMLEPADLQARNEYLRRCLNHRPEQLRFSAPPASVFVFRAGVPEAEGRFDFFVPTMSSTSDMIAMRAGEVFVIAVFGDNGYWGHKLGGIKLVQAAMSSLVLHPVQCVELMMWFAAELAGHDSSGCYDMITVVDDGGVPLTQFMPRFAVERNGAPQELLNRMRVASLFERVGFEADESLLGRAAEGRFATTLVNATTNELVQSECFELGCLDVFYRAGWDVGGEQCGVCGAT